MIILPRTYATVPFLSLISGDICQMTTDVAKACPRVYPKTVRNHQKGNPPSYSTTLSLILLCAISFKPYNVKI